MSYSNPNISVLHCLSFSKMSYWQVRKSGVLLLSYHSRIFLDHFISQVSYLCYYPSHRVRCLFPMDPVKSDWNWSATPVRSRAVSSRRCLFSRPKLVFVWWGVAPFVTSRHLFLPSLWRRGFNEPQTVQVTGFLESGGLAVDFHAYAENCFRCSRKPSYVMAEISEISLLIHVV